MVNIMRHKRSAAAGKIQFPRSELPPAESKETKESRWSGENLAPSDGYSGLFHSGYNNARLPVPNDPPTQKYTHLAPPPPSVFPSALGAGPGRRRRRSSILATAPSSPANYKSAASSVERALDDVMRNLKIMAVSPSPQKSRWSSSSSRTGEGAEMESLPRKSGESMRSKFSYKARKSEDNNNIRGRKSEDNTNTRGRKSEDGGRPSLNMDCEVPPVPPVPTTPRRLQGLRKLLTPKKKGPPPTPAPCYPLPHPPSERNPNLPLPKKSSISTLRSLTKKASTSTLNFISSSTHPSTVAYPPVPVPMPVPSTPKHISQPRDLRITWPSVFLAGPTRRAPTTPKKEWQASTPELSFASIPKAHLPARTPLSRNNTPFLVTPADAPFASYTNDLGGRGGVGTPMTPLTAKASRERIKYRGNAAHPLAHLLPKQARYNLGLERAPFPSTVASSTQKSRAGAGAGAVASIPPPIRGLPPPPPAGRYAPSNRQLEQDKSTTNYAIIDAYSRQSQSQSQVRSIHNPQEWSAPTPSLSPIAIDGTFGRSTPPAAAGAAWLPTAPLAVANRYTRSTVPGDQLNVSQRSAVSALDFTKSPMRTNSIISFGAPILPDESPDMDMDMDMDMDVDGYTDSSHGMDHGPKEEWELERYLREVEAREQGEVERVCAWAV